MINFLRDKRFKKKLECRVIFESLLFEMLFNFDYIIKMFFVGYFFEN